MPPAADGPDVADDAALERLVAFIQEKVSEGFKIVGSIDGSYGHIGATLADAVLQANNNYDKNVRKRVSRILKDYPQCATLRGLRAWLEALPDDRLARVREFLDWQGTRKPQTFLDLVDVLPASVVTTEAELRDWLMQPASKGRLRDIRFVGQKTVDYLQILVGGETVAVDTHLSAFVREAIGENVSRAVAHRLLMAAANRLEIAPSILDHSIWRHGSALRSGMPSDKPSHRRLEPC